ncbi:MAG TPA: erythromycin esterase family protein [Janthinobacterium sp.]|nr:erythromycin esterase family protein [Janthinobacterium sp.]
MFDPGLIQSLQTEAIRIDADDAGDALIPLIGDASLVLLGEASHGTREFYRIRAAVTRRLIEEHGFDAVAIEADWPDALQVSRYVQLAGGDLSADQALSGFQRFPQWMWRNTEVLEFVDWLRLHNSRIGAARQCVGFFGLDLYSLRKSMDAVIHYLDHNDPEAAQRARQRYGCFDHLAEDPQRYGYAATFGLKADCADEVVRQLCDLNQQAAAHLDIGGSVPDMLFYAQQNARVVHNAETYYRSMFDRRADSWNVRDNHMADTLAALREHIGQHRHRDAKIVVWAHNSHLGDARATEMGMQGQLNLGQLVRQRYRPEESFLLGFTTYSGTVTAATEWEGPAELKKLVPGREDSIEGLFHATGLGTGLENFLLPLRGRGSVLNDVGLRYLERAIGVIYRPESERVSHYFKADLARQFDAVIHIERSSALKPMECTANWTADLEVPETYPSGV